jgi:hypothetical protein
MTRENVVWWIVAIVLTCGVWPLLAVVSHCSQGLCIGG